MEHKLSAIFKKTSYPEPSASLEPVVLALIRAETRAKNERKLRLAYFSLAGSMAGGFFFGLEFGGSILKSEFWSVLSLAFSDLSVVVFDWENYALSLLETLPAVNMLLLLFPVIAFLLAMDFYLAISRSNKQLYAGHVN